MARPSCRWAARASLLPAVVLVACSISPPATLDDSLHLIRKRALKEHVTWLAHDDREGRMTGESGYDLSARYVADQLAAMGVAPAGVGGWFQPVTLRSYRALGEASHFLLHTPDGDEALVYRDDFNVRANPAATSATVRAEVVYVGYGVDAPDYGYSDYEGIDVRGKIVAWYAGSPDSLDGAQRAIFSTSSAKRAAAAAHGAIGAISLRSRDTEEKWPWDESKKRIDARASMTWINAAGDAADHAPEIRLTARVSQRATERLFANAPISYEASLAAIESGVPASSALNVEVTLAGESQHASLTSPNVIGLVRGTDPVLAGEYVVYTAHLDHIGTRAEDGERRVFNGAYDNALGVALMLETARAIAALPPRRSVLFVAVTAEENGLLGSDYFVNNPTVPRGSIVANINLDMPLFLYPVADLVAFGSENSTLQGVAKRAAAAEGFSLAPDPMPEENLFLRSDQYSFVRKGIPAVYLVSGFTSLDDDVDGEALYRDHLENHYHKASDDLTRPIDWDSALRFARAHARMGYVIATETERPAWLDGNAFGTRFATP